MKSLFLTLLLSTTTWAANSPLAKPDLIVLAKKAMAINLDLRHLNAGIVLEHPRLISHADYQTLIYHEVVNTRSEEGRILQWEVVGADLRFHYNVMSKTSALQNSLIQIDTKNISKGLMAKAELPLILTKALSLTEIISNEDFEIKHRLWAENGKIVPVYWIDVKKRGLQNSMKYNYTLSTRTVVVDAKTGEVIMNSSKIRHDDKSPQLPQVIIRNGQKNDLFTKKFGDDDDVADKKDIVEKYKGSCQLISNKEGSDGDPILINPPRCELAYDGQNFLPQATDASVKNAQSNSVNILNFYANKLQQWGLDFGSQIENQKRMPIVSIVHIGQKYDNAYWDEDLKVMVYGDGSGGTAKEATQDYTLALDISGHEYTHGIVSQTAHFVAEGDAGALNEAFADIFGVLIDRSVHPSANWSIGKNIYHNANNQDDDVDELALRSLSDPGRFKTTTTVDGKNVMIPFPKKYSDRLAQNEKCTDDNDYCEVHANSTIWSHTAYLVNRGLQDKLNFSAAQADLQVAKLYFLTLTHRLHENDSMKTAAVELIKACVETAPANVCDVVQSAIHDVELN